MTPNELRKACELVEIEVRCSGSYYYIDGPSFNSSMSLHSATNREWIEPYVASLLVAKVREKNAPYFHQFCANIVETVYEVGDPMDPDVGFTYTPLEGFFYYLDDEHVIRAAYRVLTGEELSDE